MKRVISLFLLLSYLLSSPGLVYSMHFCGQELTAVSVVRDGATNCCCRDTSKPAGRCCHNKKVSSALKDVKLSAPHSKRLVPDLVPAPPVLRLVWQLSQAAHPTNEPVTSLLLHAAPPPECPAYVRGHALLV
ncbi:MAG: hypothetical protein NVS3B25_15600 [Hymenobacter sp.]